MKKAALLIMTAAFMLTACSNDISDLEAYISYIKARNPSRIDPFPMESTPTLAPRGIGRDPFEFLVNKVDKPVTTNAVQLVFLRRDADSGDVNAQTYLGYLYAAGNGVEKDMTEAVKWWRIAADNGFMIAQYNIGVAYEEGDGVEKNGSEALKWYELAAAQGLSTAKEAAARLSGSAKSN